MLLGLLQMDVIKFRSCSEASVIRLWTDLRIKRPVIPNFRVKILILHLGDMYSIYTKVKVKLTIYRPGQALRAAGSWGFKNFQTIVSRRGQGCQPYPPAVFAHLYSLY